MTVKFHKLNQLQNQYLMVKIQRFLITTINFERTLKNFDQH